MITCRLLISYVTGSKLQQPLHRCGSTAIEAASWCGEVHQGVTAFAAEAKLTSVCVQNYLARYFEFQTGPKSIWLRRRKLAPTIKICKIYIYSYIIHIFVYIYVYIHLYMYIYTTDISIYI